MQTDDDVIAYVIRGFVAAVCAALVCSQCGAAEIGLTRRGVSSDSLYVACVGPTGSVVFQLLDGEGARWVKVSPGTYTVTCQDKSGNGMTFTTTLDANSRRTYRYVGGATFQEISDEVKDAESDAAWLLRVLCAVGLAMVSAHALRSGIQDGGQT